MLCYALPDALDTGQRLGTRAQPAMKPHLPFGIAGHWQAVAHLVLALKRGAFVSSATGLFLQHKAAEQLSRGSPAGAAGADRRLGDLLSQASLFTDGALSAHERGRKDPSEGDAVAALAPEIKAAALATAARLISSPGWDR